MSLPVASGLGNLSIFVFNTITTLNLLVGPMLLAGQCPVGMVTWVDLVGQKFHGLSLGSNANIDSNNIATEDMYVWTWVALE